MKRLAKITKMAKLFPSKHMIELHGFITKSGLYYCFNVRLLNNKPIFSIYCQDMFDNSSLYDGYDFEEAFEFFCELLIALKGVSFAENFARTRKYVEQQIQTLVDTTQDMTLKVKPLSLGDSEQAIS